MQYCIFSFQNNSYQSGVGSTKKKRRKKGNGKLTNGRHEERRR